MISRIASVFVQAFLLACSGLLLSQCASSSYEHRGSTLWGQSETIKFYAKTNAQGQLKTSELYAGAKVIGKYRRMNATEAEILRAVAQKNFDFEVALDYEALRPKYESKIREVERKRVQQRKSIAQAQKQGRLKAAEAALSKAKMEQESEQELVVLNIDWKREASALAQKRIGGSSFALAVQADQQKKNLIGIARIVEDRVEVSRDLLEIEKPLLVLDARRSVQVQGREVTVLQTTPVPLPPEPEEVTAP